MYVYQNLMHSGDLLGASVGGSVASYLLKINNHQLPQKKKHWQLLPVLLKNGGTLLIYQSAGAFCFRSVVRLHSVVKHGAD